jgi:hypothetical protein
MCPMPTSTHQKSSLSIFNDQGHDCSILGFTNRTPLQESRPRDLGRIREKMGKIYLKLFFSFPSSFIFSMVTPLHFAHLYHIISCNVSQRVKNLDRILRVSQITLNTELFHWFLFLRDTETLLKLRHMKYIMHIR